MMQSDTIAFCSLQNPPGESEIQTPRSAERKKMKPANHRTGFFAKAPANFADTSIASEIALSKVSVLGRKPHTSLKGMRCKTEWEKGNYKKKENTTHVPFLPNEFTPSPSFFALSLWVPDPPPCMISEVPQTRRDSCRLAPFSTPQKEKSASG